MNERPKHSRLVRSVAYPLLALVAAFASPGPDVVTMLYILAAGVVLLEAGFFAYRRWLRPGG